MLFTDQIVVGGIIGGIVGGNIAVLLSCMIICGIVVSKVSCLYLVGKQHQSLNKDTPYKLHKN